MRIPWKGGREMNIWQSLLFFAVSLLASIAGAICGIGGGVIIKPTLDLFGWASVSTISFLSGCTVLTMSWYSVIKSLSAKDDEVDLEEGTPLAAGAAIGGVIGKQLFTFVKSQFVNQNTVGAVQAFCLALITLLTLVYTINKKRIHTHHVKGMLPCILIGLVLGMSSSFLGIGGGPINLMVLGFFFSMDSKKAAANSLYIILFSQIANLLVTLVTQTVPEFDVITLLLMVAGGLLGGMAGRRINRHINSAAVDKLFMGLMTVIIGISLYNTWQYAVG